MVRSLCVMSRMCLQLKHSIAIVSPACRLNLVHCEGSVNVRARAVAFKVRHVGGFHVTSASLQHNAMNANSPVFWLICSKRNISETNMAFGQGLCASSSCSLFYLPQADFPKSVGSNAPPEDHQPATSVLAISVLADDSQLPTQDSLWL